MQAQWSLSASLERMSDLFKVTQLVHGRGEIWTHCPSLEPVAPSWYHHLLCTQSGLQQVWGPSLRLWGSMDSGEDIGHHSWLFKWDAGVNTRSLRSKYGYPLLCKSSPYTTSLLWQTYSSTCFCRVSKEDCCFYKKKKEKKKGRKWKYPSASVLQRAVGEWHH